MYLSLLQRPRTLGEADLATTRRSRGLKFPPAWAGLGLGLAGGQKDKQKGNSKTATQKSKNLSPFVWDHHQPPFLVLQLVAAQAIIICAATELLVIYPEFIYGTHDSDRYQSCQIRGGTVRSTLLQAPAPIMIMTRVARFRVLGPLLQITGERSRETLLGTECLPDQIQHCTSVKVLPVRCATLSTHIP